MTKSYEFLQPPMARHEAGTEWLEVTPGERFTIRTSAKATSGAYLAFEVVADPGNGVPVHVHANEEEHFIVIEGMARLLNGDMTLDLPVGSTVTVAKGVPHAWCNLGSVPLRMLVVFTPGHIEELFLAVAGGVSDDDFARLLIAHGTRIIGPPLLEGIYSVMSPRPQAN